MPSMRGVGPVSYTRPLGKLNRLAKKCQLTRSRRDLRLVELCVKRGADVFVRDKKGRRVLEGEKGADERIKAFLRQCQSDPQMCTRS